MQMHERGGFFMGKKLWGHAFTTTPDEAIIAFTAGRDVHPVPASDIALVPYDIWVNIVHCLMLVKTGIIPDSDAKQILLTLLQLQQLVEEKKFTLDPALEDVHTNIESWITAKIGIESAGKLHTARSRNDQVLTDTLLFLRDTALSFTNECSQLALTLCELGKTHAQTLAPGFTHHQHAMITSLGHILAGYGFMIIRDCKKFQQWVDLHDISPLGSVASYSTSFPIDSVYTARLLGFSMPPDNSFENITNRWEAESDLVFAISSLMNHLSSLSEILILWGMPEFGMISLADLYSTGSSIMPQKKNPDPLEVLKGKTSVVHGQLVGLLGIGKAGFLGYNRDTQWTKYMVMDVTRECIHAPAVISGVLSTMTVHKDVMAVWCTKNMIGATSLLEQLTHAYKIPFRVAKVLVEKAILQSENRDVIYYGAMKSVLADARMNIPITRKQIRQWQDPEYILGHTIPAGGPGNAAMEQSLTHLKQEIIHIQEWLDEKNGIIVSAKQNMTIEIQKLLTKGGV